MTITRQQFIDELMAARAADPLACAEGNHAYAAARAEMLFGPDLRTKEGVEKWMEKTYGEVDPILQPGVVARPQVHVVETEHEVVLISPAVPSALVSEMSKQGLEVQELDVEVGWGNPTLEIVVAWKGTK